MEMHHKLRRDPNWHPNACNICGQLGHQASTCPNGTVDWKERYGVDAFRVIINRDPKDYRDPTPYEWEVMMNDLKKKADEFKALRAKVEEINLDELAEKAAEALKEAQEQMATQAAAVVPQAEQPPAAVEPPKDELPPGWASAKDPQGRTYYYFKKTQKVQWDKPTAESETGE